LVGSVAKDQSPIIFRTIAYATITATSQCLLGTVAALAVHGIRRRWLRHAFAGLFIIPYAAPSFAGILGWKFLLGDATPLARLVAWCAKIEGTDVLGTDRTSFAILCVVSIWQFFPFVFFFIYCRLLAVSRDILRCAAIEGLNRLQRLAVIFLPQIIPAVAGLFIIRVLFMFSKYDTAALLGGSGLVRGLRVLPIELFDLFAGAGGPSAAVRAFLVAMCLAVALFGFLYTGLTSRLPARGFPLKALGNRGLANIYSGFLHVLLVSTALFVIVPLAGLFLGSLMPSENLDRGIRWSPNPLPFITVKNYMLALKGEALGDLGTPFWNSAVCLLAVGAAVALGSIVVGHLASRVFYRNSVVLNTLLVFAYSLPPVLLVFPFAKFQQRFGLPSLTVIIAAHIGFITPFCLRLAKDYFSNVSPLLDRVAASDGASSSQSLVSVILPRLKAELSMIAMFAMIISWNDIVFSRYLGPDRYSKTLIDVLDTNLKNRPDLTDYGAIAAFSFLLATAAAILFMVLQSHVFSHTETLSERY
jgi:multiple sugar transport system permease protein